MSELTQWFLIVGMVGWMIGMVMGKFFEARIWRNKGNWEHRTGMFSGGKMYYVVTEQEYCDVFIPAKYADNCSDKEHP